MRGKENKYMDKGTNAKKLRNFGINLRKKYVCMTGGDISMYDKRLSGVYILL